MLLMQESDNYSNIVDPVLKLIADWCDLHGWDKLDGKEFNEWLKAQGIERDSLMIGRCNIAEGL